MHQNCNPEYESLCSEDSGVISDMSVVAVF